ncbi:MAG: hypothetical protein ACP5HS_07660 [Anaerolineae bacterium]
MRAYEPVCVEGDPNQIDSFIACLTAVLNAWDRPVTYDWVAGLAGIAFSPVLDPGEDCMAWWMEAGSDSRIGFLGRALGFTVERVTRAAAWDDEAREAYERTGLLPEPHESHFARLRAAFDRGDAILLRTWPSWSVLSGWDRDLDRLPFVTVPGFDDLVARIWGPAQAQLAFLLYPVQPQFTIERSVRCALHFGTRMARGQGDDEALRYGAALYEAARQRMAGNIFCSACGSNGDSCAHRTLMRMLGTQRSAIGFLEDARDLVDDVASRDDRLPWAEAIARFEAMAEMTTAYCSWQDFHEAWTDEAFRQELREDFGELAKLQGDAADALARLSAAYDRYIEA